MILSVSDKVFYFCLERMLSVKELPGVQSLCIKIAYELCRTIPELTQELKTTLEMMEGELCPAIMSVRKNILKAIPKGKSLQKGLINKDFSNSFS